MIDSSRHRRSRLLSATGVRTAGVAAAAVLALGGSGCATPEPGRVSSPTVGSGAAALLTFDAVQCRDKGTVEAAGVVWQLVDPVPLAWREVPERAGTLRVTHEEEALFTADDGTELRLTTGSRPLGCRVWDELDPDLG